MAPQKRMTPLILGERMDLSTGEMLDWSQRNSNSRVGHLPSVGLPSRGVNSKVGFINNIDLFIYLFIWLHWVLVVVGRIFSCGVWFLVH